MVSDSDEKRFPDRLLDLSKIKNRQQVDNQINKPNQGKHRCSKKTLSDLIAADLKDAVVAWLVACRVARPGRTHDVNLTISSSGFESGSTFFFNTKFLFCVSALHQESMTFPSICLHYSVRSESTVAVQSNATNGGFCAQENFEFFISASMKP